MKRKAVAGVLGSALLGGLLYGLSGRISSPIPLGEFPSSIAGASKIDRYPVAGALYTLIHIRQDHHASSVSEEYNKIIVDCQRDIYSILNAEIQRTGLENVFNESLAQEYKEEFLGALEESKGYWKTTVASLTGERKTRLRDKWLRTLGASSVLFLEDKLQSLEPAENLLLNHETIRVADEYTDAVNNVNKQYDAGIRGGLEAELKKIELLKRKFDSLNERREDFALFTLADFLSKRENKTGYLVFGGAHDFTNNVYEWNIHNPDKKFNLFVVTPESFKPSHFLDNPLQ